MCRLLVLRSEKPIDPIPYLRKFALIAKNSKEFQGHGWGITWSDGEVWNDYKNLKPIWKDNFSAIPRASTFLVHARSAFQDEGIEIANNMPFNNNRLAFIFNGELRGVKLNVNGRIGAEKIFNFIQRFNRYGIGQAIDRSLPIIENRTEYIRAMNFIISDSEKLYISNYYNEDPEYFSLHIAIEGDTLIICSEPFAINGTWSRMENYSIKVIA